MKSLGSTLSLLLVTCLPLLAAEASLPATGRANALLESKARKVFAQVETLIGSLKYPQDLQFANSCESYDPVRKTYRLAYDPLTHLLSYQGLRNYIGEHAEKNRQTLLAHEYGHAIFRANLDLLNASVDDHFSESLELRDLQRKAVKTASTCEISTDDQKAVSGFSKRMLDHDYFTFDALRLGAYDELFADIIAVMHTSRGDAVYQAVGGASVDWGKKYYVKLPEGYRGRDFTYPLTVEEWHDNKRLILFYDFVGGVSDTYNALDPVRSHIWQAYLKNMPKEKYPELLKAYLRAVGVEFKRYKAEGIWEQPVREMNERFIKELDLQMAKVGL